MMTYWTMSSVQIWWRWLDWYGLSASRWQCHHWVADFFKEQKQWSKTVFVQSEAVYLQKCDCFQWDRHVFKRKIRKFRRSARQNKEVNGSDRRRKRFISRRVLLQCIGVNCRPEVYATAQCIAPRKEMTTKSLFVSLRKASEHLKRSARQELNFVKLVLGSMWCDLILGLLTLLAWKRRIGFVILMADRAHRGSIVHYASSECHRITRLVTDAEAQLLINVVGIRTLDLDTLDELLELNVELEVFTDSCTLFKLVMRNGNGHEHGFLTDIFAYKVIRKENDEALSKV